jgi:imidazolonepropionase-like amidohydrolase
MQSARIEAAKGLGVEEEAGSIEVGKRGDVVLLDADPLKNIHNIRMGWKTAATGIVRSGASME